MKLRLASYNIRLGLEQGLSAVGATLRAHSVDCVAVQEVGRDWVMGEPVDQMETLARQLDLAYWLFCPTIQRHGHLFGHGLLSRYPLREVERFELPRRRDEPRRALASVVELGSRSLPVISLHLSHLDDERPPQIEALRTWVEARWPQGPLVLMGDLNEPHPAQQIADWPLLGCDDLGAGEDTPTFPARVPVDRRDVILVRGMTQVGALRVVESLASDHRPIVADVMPELG